MERPAGALFLVLTGGVAYAVDTVGSADVIDNSLLSADLKNNKGVKSVDVADDTVAGGGLGGQDIAADALGGSDVNESSLGEVPLAADAGFAASADLLDGIDSSGFVQGGGSAFVDKAFAAGGADSTLADIPGYAEVTLHCSADAHSATIGVTNQGAPDSFVVVYADTGSANPGFEIVTEASGEKTVATVGGAPVERDMAHILLAESNLSDRAMTMTVGTSTTGGGCNHYTHAVFTE